MTEGRVQADGEVKDQSDLTPPSSEKQFQVQALPNLE
jgi:hypothetical protein